MCDRPQVKPEEIKEVIQSYSDNAEPKKIQTNGFHIGGEKFMTVRAEGRAVYGKKVRSFVFTIARFRCPYYLSTPEESYANVFLSTFTQGKEGVIIDKTTQAILVAHYPENVQPGNATTVVEKLADYLVSVGY